MQPRKNLRDAILNKPLGDSGAKVNVPTRRPAPPQPDLKSAIVNKVEGDIRAKLNIPASSPLPTNIRAMIEKTASDADSALTEKYVRREALLAGKRFFRDEKVEDTIKTRLATALQGVQLVSASSDLQKMIDENARMLFMKKQALRNAGFTDDEAFKLILAEVTAKKSK